MVFVQACLKGKVPGNIKNTTEMTGEHHVSHVEKGFLFRLQNLPQEPTNSERKLVFGDWHPSANTDHPTHFL